MVALATVIVGHCWSLLVIWDLFYRACSSPTATNSDRSVLGTIDMGPCMYIQYAQYFVTNDYAVFGLSVWMYSTI